tara:strand:+ start:182 stop:802 length:621 start_codon:yes stop_codon:yes gene_type:complete
MYKLDNSKIYSYFILAARLLLAGIFISYGIGKLTSTQFGLSDEELITPIGELSNFRISWYLFDLQPFKAFVGVSQLICGLLLLWNRAVILGALLFLPIAANILVMDMSFMPRGFAEAFTWRLSYYLVLDGLILLHYRDRVSKAWNSLVTKSKMKFKFSIWIYLSLPIAAALMELLSPRFFYHLFRNPFGTVRSIIDLLSDTINRLV